MTVRPLAALIMAGALAAAGCTPPPPPQSRSSIAARAACRTQSDAAFNRQNRALLSTRDTTDTPFSTSGNSGITTTGLSREYARETMLDDCLRNARGGPDTGVVGDGTAFQGPSARTPSLPAE